MGDLSAHFDRSEFRCRGHGRRGHRAHQTVVRADLIVKLERVRLLVGRPVYVVSGHRCLWWNGQVGGASRSQHLYGAAADIPMGLLTEREAEACGFNGVGTRDGWAVHVDVRANRAHWRY